jgi:DNA-binding response OmpR family regulator
LKGTTVFMYLPAVDTPPAAEAAPAPADNVKPMLGTETILLVEEDTSVALLIESFLTRLGYRVVHAPDAHAGHRAADAYGHALDLAIASAGASINAATSFIESLRAKHPGLPAIVIAGFSASPLDVPPASPGSRILTKPFAMAELAASARELLDA